MFPWGAARPPNPLGFSPPESWGWRRPEDPGYASDPLASAASSWIRGWVGVRPFEVQYVVPVGDVNNDGKVLANDLSAVFPRIPSPPVPKPNGH